MTQQHGNSDGKILPYLARNAPKSGMKSMLSAPKCEHTAYGSVRRRAYAIALPAAYRQIKNSVRDAKRGAILDAALCFAFCFTDVNQPNS